MLRRTFALMAVVAVATWAIPASAADPTVHQMKVVKAEADKLTVTDKDGKNQQTVAVPTTAKVTLDGKPCKVEDLKAGTDVKITTEKKGDAVVIVSVAGGKAG